MIGALVLAAGACLSDPAAILSANQQASRSGQQAPATVTAVYDVSDSGLEGRETRIVDTASGSFAEQSDVGPILGGGGFDGTQAWTRDLTGYFSLQSGGNTRQLAINQAYRNANRWWGADRGGAHIEQAGCDHIRITPVGGAPFEARFDGATHLLASVREDTTFANKAEFRYSAYQRRSGQMIATRIEVIANDDPATIVTRTLMSWTASARRPAEAYAMPQKQPEDWRIARAGRITLPFRLVNNHIIVDVSVNGRRPLPFLLDTGGHEIVTPTAAAKLKLKALGAGQAGGGGEKTVASGFATLDRIEAGGATLVRPNVVVTEFSPLDVEGIELGGMLGVGFMERFVVEIDYAQRVVTVSDPARFNRAAQSKAGVAVPIQFYDHMPQVAGRYDGKPTRYNIDTGSRADVSFTSPFARERLAAAAKDGSVVTDGWGAGGPTRSVVVRAEPIELGDARICGALAGLSVATRGTFSDANFDGNIGSGLLKRFRVTFDYRRQTMYLSPYSRLEPDTGKADRSGMWLNLAAKGLSVMDVMAGGPAAKAGLQVGDMLTRVDGEPVRTRSLSDWRIYFKIVENGRSISIHYVRGDGHQAAILSPAAIIPDPRC